MIGSLLEFIGPNGYLERVSFLEDLASLYGLCGFRWYIGEDFNVVRFIAKISNEGRQTPNMIYFNNFTRDTNLCDPAL